MKWAGRLGRRPVVRISALCLVAATLLPAVPASANDCAAIRRTRILARAAGLDDANLARLEQLHCGRALVAAPIGFTEECVALSMMAEAAWAESDDVALLQLVEGVRVAVCEGPQGGALRRWPDGQTLRSGSTYYWPSGRVAFSSGFGTLHYPSGRTARSSTGTWSYPDGETAQTSGGRWRTPEGASMASARELSTWACGHLDANACRQALRQAQSGPRIVQEAAIVRLAWIARRRDDQRIPTTVILRGPIPELGEVTR